METRQKKKRLFSLRYFVWDFVKVTGVIPAMLWYRPKVRYITPDAKKKIKGGALLIANHTGFADPIHVMCAVWYRRHRFICMKEIMEGNLGWLFKWFLCISVDRENMNMATFRQITDCLQEGWLVSMFPEGHINDGSGNMGAFKSGMVLMALRGGKPIVPVYIKPRKNFWQRVVIAMGESVDITELYGSRPTFAQINEITQLLYQKEEELKQFAEEE